MFFYSLNEVENMPIIRKVVDFGKTSRGVILPKTWLEYYEKESGREIREVAIEVNKELKILPYIRRKEKALGVMEG